MRDKEIIKKTLQKIIIGVLSDTPPPVMLKTERVWFVFDEDSIMTNDDKIAFASYESLPRTVTFYLEMISRHDFDKKRLIELVIHEYIHVLGQTQEDIVGKTVEKLNEYVAEFMKRHKI